MGVRGLKYTISPMWASFFIKDLTQSFDGHHGVYYWKVIDGGALITENYRDFSDRLAIL